MMGFPFVRLPASGPLRNKLLKYFPCLCSKRLQLAIERASLSLAVERTFRSLAIERKFPPLRELRETWAGPQFPPIHQRPFAHGPCVRHCSGAAQCAQPNRPNPCRLFLMASDGRYGPLLCLFKQAIYRGAVAHMRSRREAHAFMTVSENNSFCSHRSGGASTYISPATRMLARRREMIEIQAQLTEQQRLYAIKVL